jgi:hypothetical protein
LLVPGSFSQAPGENLAPPITAAHRKKASTKKKKKQKRKAKRAAHAHLSGRTANGRGRR